MRDPRVSDLMRGKIDVFGLDALVNMAATAGLHVRLSVQKNGLIGEILRFMYITVIYINGRSLEDRWLRMG